MSNNVMQFKIVDCLEKLDQLSKEGQLQLIYEWTKTGYIDFHVFQKLIAFIKVS